MSKYTTPALDDTQTRVFHALQKAQFAITLLDAQYNVFFASQGVEHFIGYTAEELVASNGGKLYELQHPQDIARTAKQVTYTVPMADNEERPLVARFSHKDGHWRWLRIRMVNMLNDPDVRAIVAYTHEATSREIADAEAANAAMHT